MSTERKNVMPFELHRDNAPAYWEVDILWAPAGRWGTNRRAFSQLEQLCAKDSGPPPHTHTQTENFYIMDGQITFLIDDQILIGTKGSFVTVPPGTVCSIN